MYDSVHGLNLALIKMCLSSRAYISYAKSWMTQFTGQHFLCLKMYDSVHGSAFLMLNQVWQGSRACISYANPCITQFTGLYLALIKMRLSSGAYISFAKSSTSRFTGTYAIMTQFQICISYVKLCMPYNSCESDSVQGSAFPIMSHVRLSSQSVI